jgi:uncharacterized cupredoxin-like copper-binding protein
MIARRFGTALGPLLLVAAGAAGAAIQPQYVDIKLQDSTTDPSIAHMRIVIDHAKVKPGRVTFRADNQSKALQHEVLIALDDGGAALPFDAAKDRVVERRTHPLGEIADLAPGKSGSVSLNLRPGTYMLFCNLPGHYKDGMYAKLVVAQ